MTTEEWALLLLALFLFTRPKAAPQGDLQIGDAAIGQQEIQDRGAEGWNIQGQP